MSGKAPKQKGNRIEREIVNLAKDMGYNARRAWSSDGRSLGWHEEVDVTLWGEANKQDPWKFQVKGRKAIADYLKPCEFVDGQILKEDRKNPLVVIDLKWFLCLLKNSRKKRLKT
jgi:hypothetical protein